jgi:TonB family protein
VEDMPQFPGGEVALHKFLGSELRYPVSAQENGIQGRVYISFVISAIGNVEDAKVARGVDPLLDAEALRVINAMPQWKPGRQRGVDVAVQYTVPINFALQKSPAKEEIDVNEEIISIKKDEASPAGTKDRPTFFQVEEMPEFPGGEKALQDFVQEQLRYPEEAKEKGIQGRVYIKFVVSASGNVKEAKVAKGVDPLLDTEALRVINAMPPWKPGKQRGENVAVSYVVPVNFVPPLEPKKLKTIIGEDKMPFKKKNNTITEDKDKPVFFVVEEMPEFPGGKSEMNKFIATHVKYPPIAQQNGIEGKVYVVFEVSPTGSVENVNVAKGVDPVLDAEALRVVKSMPDWKPGKQRGKNVAVTITVPVEFHLQ